MATPLYRYYINLFRVYKQFEVLVPYQYPADGIPILTAQYGGKDNVRIEYRGEA